MPPPPWLATFVVRICRFPLPKKKKILLKKSSNDFFFLLLGSVGWPRKERERES